MTIFWNNMNPGCCNPYTRVNFQVIFDCISVFKNTVFKNLFLATRLIQFCFLLKFWFINFNLFLLSCFDFWFSAYTSSWKKLFPLGQEIIEVGSPHSFHYCWVLAREATVALYSPWWHLQYSGALLTALLYSTQLYCIVELHRTV